MTNSTIQTTYLVTGVAGNLGNSVATRLLADGQRVRGLVLPGDPAVARVPAGVEIHTGDITNWGWVAPEQFTMATRATALLADAGIPYAFASGNHDVAVVGHNGVAGSRGYGGSAYVDAVAEGSFPAQGHYREQ